MKNQIGGYDQVVKKLRIGVIYGGRSGEHEISVASAASVIKSLDRSRYEPLPIRIEKDGRWTIADKPPTAVSAAEVIAQARGSGTRALRPGRETVLVGHPSEDTLLTIERRPPARGSDDEGIARVTGLGLDVVFPVLHGPYGEDGTIQGLLELANVPYVGPGVLASAVGMDKAAMRLMFAAHGLPIAPWKAYLRRDWEQHRDAVTESALSLTLPLFVKPANLGSSVGISKVKTVDDLAPAIERALEFDRKVVIEWGVPDAREIECAVIGNDEPQASLPGEVIPGREFYDYEAKYLDEGSRYSDSSRVDAGAGRRHPAIGRCRVPRGGCRRLVTSGLPALARDRNRLPQRDQHHPGLHHHQHVRQDVGGQRPGVSGTGRSAHPARARAPR